MVSGCYVVCVKKYFKMYFFPMDIEKFVFSRFPSECMALNAADRKV